MIAPSWAKKSGTTLSHMAPFRRYRVEPVTELLPHRASPPRWWGLRPPGIDYAALDAGNIRDWCRTVSRGLS